jgi:UrcA family protein
MYTRTVFMSVRSLLGATTLACTLLSGTVAASDHTLTISLQVNSEGLDLTQPSDAQKFYARLDHAAQIVCTHGERVDLAPVDDPKACHEKALAEAVRAAKVPMLTQIYFTYHTLQQGAALGIEVPVQTAAK